FAYFAAVELWDDEARLVILERTARRQREQGALHPLRLTLLALATALIVTGRLADAEACYHESTELTLAVGQEPGLSVLMNAELLAWRGKEAETRATVLAGIEGTSAAGFAVFEYLAMEAITVLELGTSNYAAAGRAARASYDDDLPVTGNWSLPYV